MFATSSQHNLTNMVGLNKFIEFLSFLIDFYVTEKNITRCCQLCPRYEGQLTWMAEPIPPFRSILLVPTHDCIITQIYGPTGGDGHGWFERRGRWFAHHFDAV